MSDDIKFAIETVRLAGRLVQDLQQDLGSLALRKEDRSPVTVADFSSQALVGERFIRYRPEDPLVAEESSKRLMEDHPTLQRVIEAISRIHPGASQEEICEWIDRGAMQAADRYWTLDPIDGTKGFLRGDQYVVALALIENGRVLLGAMSCPNLNAGLQPEIGGPGCVVYAQRGYGAWVLGRDGGKRRLKVSAVEAPSQVRLLRSFEDAHTDTRQLTDLIERMGIQADPVRMDSQAKYALMADGNGDLLFRLVPHTSPGYREYIWDQAAGSLIVEEAGGRVTDLMGKDLDFNQSPRLANNIGVLASNGSLHSAALEALEAVLAD
jgi:HAL2 family 3'(2'),5'-bisphosphate nucleotidase